MVTLDTLKSYLKDLKYPGITFMSNDEIADIFSKTNRLFFLTWFIQKWDPDITLPSDEKKKIQMLINNLHDNGFCSYQNSVKFVQDTLEMPPEEQVLIFNRMLYNLQILTSEKETPKLCEPNYLEEMEKFSKFDINLFSSLGPLKTRSLNERLEKIKLYEEEVSQLKEEIKLLNNENSQDKCINYKTDFSNVQIDLKDEIPALVSNCSAILKDTTKEEHKATFTEDYEHITNNCYTNMSKIIKFCESKKFINEFVVEKNIVESVKNNALFETVGSLAKLSAEILDE